MIGVQEGIPDRVSQRSGWVGVRCVFRLGNDRPHAYEERVTLWRADDLDTGIARAEAEAREYAEVLDAEYLGFAQAYLLSDEPDDGAEVFSLIRESDLDPETYLHTHFDTGTERQQRTGEGDNGSSLDPNGGAGINVSCGRDGIGSALPQAERRSYALAVRVTRQELVRLFWALDRALGGEQPPTRVQRFAARRPLASGALTGAPFSIFFLLLVLGTGGSTGAAMIALGSGALLGLVYSLTALLERQRQLRLQRLGLWRQPQ